MSSCIVEAKNMYIIWVVLVQDIHGLANLSQYVFICVVSIASLPSLKQYSSALFSMTGISLQQHYKNENYISIGTSQLPKLCQNEVHNHQRRSLTLHIWFCTLTCVDPVKFAPVISKEYGLVIIPKNDTRWAKIIWFSSSISSPLCHLV